MPWINALWGWAQSLNTPPAALPPFVPAPLEPPAVRQEQFGNNHVDVSAHTARQMMHMDALCLQANGRATMFEPDFEFLKTLDVVVVEPKK